MSAVDITTIRFNGLTHDWEMLIILPELAQVRITVIFSAGVLINSLRLTRYKE